MATWGAEESLCTKKQRGSFESVFVRSRIIGRSGFASWRKITCFPIQTRRAEGKLCLPGGTPLRERRARERETVGFPFTPLKFRPARMVQRSEHCLDAELGEIAIPVQMPGRLRKDEKTL